MVITTAYYKARNVIALVVSYTAGRINEKNQIVEWLKRVVDCSNIRVVFTRFENKD